MQIKKFLEYAFQICIFLILSYSLGIETINTFIRSCSSLGNHACFQTKMGKVYTCFQTKKAQKSYPLGGTYLYSLYKGVPPGYFWLTFTFFFRLFSLCECFFSTSPHNFSKVPSLNSPCYLFIYLFIFSFVLTLSCSFQKCEGWSPKEGC